MSKAWSRWTHITDVLFTESAPGQATDAYPQMSDRLRNMDEDLLIGTWLEEMGE